MDLKLVQVEDDIDFKTFKLCNEKNEYIVNFDVEINKETALISYDTKEKFRNKGFASRGLNLVKEVLFSDNSILFLELINLSGDYSRKVAENAGFFSPTNTINYYISLHPHAKEIVNDRLCNLDVSSVGYKNSKKQLNRINSLRIRESIAKEKLRSKLEQLLQERELVESGDYKDYIEAEISHLQKILVVSEDVEKKTR